MVKIIKESKNHKVSKKILVYGILNILVSLILNLPIISDSGIFIFLIIVVMHFILWYYVVKYIVDCYKNLNHFSLFEIKSIIGILFAILHIVIYFYIYDLATASKAQSQLAWAFVGYIDMSLSPWFFASLPLTQSLTISSILVYGVFGTIFWYIAGTIIWSKIYRDIYDDN